MKQNLFKSSIALLLLSLFSIADIQAAETDSVKAIDYKPTIHGAFRGRFEQSTVESLSRFQVRNARLNVAGMITKGIDYYAQVDLCDRGKIKILDVWGRFKPINGLAIQLGQFRMPFGVESFLGPATYWFGNRSYMGGTMCNYRAVGGKVGYTLPKVPLTIEAGVFNPNTIDDHTEWHRPMAYATKAILKPGPFTFSAGFMSIRPDRVRSNLADFAVTWTHNRWRVAGEYMYQHYTGNAFDDAHSYVAQVDYAMPIKAWKFNQLSFQGRFDGITDFSNGISTENGTLTTNTPGGRRITVGSTISYIRKPSLHADIRLNYEKMFFDNNVTVTPDMGDKLLLELVIAF